jgi:hypothetical protein
MLAMIKMRPVPNSEVVLRAIDSRMAMDHTRVDQTAWPGCGRRPPMIDPAPASYHQFDLDRKKTRHIFNVHQVEHIEAVGLTDHYLGRREREC